MPSKNDIDLFEGEGSFASPEPLWELRGVARTLLAQGYDRATLIEELAQIMDDPGGTGRESDWEIVYALLGCFEVGCVPHFAL